MIAETSKSLVITVDPSPPLSPPKSNPRSKSKGKTGLPFLSTTGSPKEKQKHSVHSDIKRKYSEGGGKSSSRSNDSKKKSQTKSKKDGGSSREEEVKNSGKDGGSSREEEMKPSPSPSPTRCLHAPSSPNHPNTRKNRSHSTREPKNVPLNPKDSDNIPTKRRNPKSKSPYRRSKSALPVTNTKFSLNLASVKDKETSPQDDVPSVRTSEIVEGFIWLGNMKDAKNLRKLRQLGITHILNCADDVSNFFEGEFVYCNLQVKDFARDSGISRVFPKALQFVQEVVDSKGKLLVHCLAGQNRSVTISIIILMHLYQWTLRQSYDFLLAKREGICPFDDNKKELIQYELLSYGTSSMNEKDFILVENLRRPETAHV